jgi:hypothetical protein
MRQNQRFGELLADVFDIFHGELFVYLAFSVPSDKLVVNVRIGIPVVLRGEDDVLSCLFAMLAARYSSGRKMTVSLLRDSTTCAALWMCSRCPILLSLQHMCLHM